MKPPKSSYQKWTKSSYNQSPISVNMSFDYILTALIAKHKVLIAIYLFIVMSFFSYIGGEAQNHNIQR